MERDWKLTDSKLSELYRRFGSVIKIKSPAIDAGIPEYFVFRDMINKDIINSKGLTDMSVIFKNALVFPDDLTIVDIQSIKEKYYGFIEKVSETLLERYNKEVDFDELSNIFSAFDFELHGVSGISVLIQIMGNPNVKEVYDLVMNNSKNYVQSLTYFASRFSGVDEIMEKKQNRVKNKTELKKKLTGDGEPDQNPVDKFYERKTAKYQEAIEASKDALTRQVEKDKANRYRHGSSSIDFEKQNSAAILSGGIGQRELDKEENKTPTTLYDPKGLTRGKLTNDLLVKRR